MILSKRFLNEQVQKRVIHEDASYERSFYQRKELNNYDVFISYTPLCTQKAVNLLLLENTFGI